MEELIRRSDALIECEGLTPIECLAMQERIKSIPAVEPKTKVIAQVAFDGDKLREIVHKAVERIKEEYDIVDNPDAVSEWIPCSERLPEEDAIYLVSAKQKALDTEFDGVLTSFFSTRNGWLSLNNDDRILAWMPLPEPYKEGADDDNNL